MDSKMELDMCSDFGDIFSLVKQVVMNSLGEHRVGLMLYLGNLPLNVGAFHPLESNGIVLNRKLLDKISTDKTSSEWKAYTFSILLHEYLHTLGYIDEREVKGLVYQISAENFGRTHPITKATVSGPWVNLSQEDFMEMRQELDIELVKDFERINHRYIV